MTEYPEFYPEATWLNDGQSGGTYTDDVFQVAIHTTETSGLPGYANGGTAPHLTYDPRSRQWWQHQELIYASRALRNESGGVQTNRHSVIQVEIIAYSAKNIADQSDARDWVGELPATAYDDLRDFLRWCRENFDVQYVWPGKQAVSYSEANAPGFRMTNEEWEAFNGVCGHQHIPENYHWDPGAFDWLQLMEGIEEMGYPLKYDDKNSAVGGLQYNLNRYTDWENEYDDGDYTPLKIDKHFGAKTAAALRVVFPGATDGDADEDLVVEEWWSEQLKERNENRLNAVSAPAIHGNSAHVVPLAEKEDLEAHEESPHTGDTTLLEARLAATEALVDTLIAEVDSLTAEVEAQKGFDDKIRDLT